MEIQGLSNAQNIHSQHGALHRITSSPARSTPGSLPRFLSVENEASVLLESPESDNNNNTGPRTSQFRQMAENGREADRSPVSKPQPNDTCSGPGDRQTLCNMNIDKEGELNALFGPQELGRPAWRYGAESGDIALQMALPLLEGEEEPPTQQRPRSVPGLRQRQQHEEDGASEQPPLAGLRAPAPGSGSCGTDGPRSQELFVVFNVQNEDSGGQSKPRPEVSVTKGDKLKGKKPESPRGSMECADSSNVVQCDSTDDGNGLESQALIKTEQVYHVLNEFSSSVKQSDYFHTVEDVVLTNKYGDKICGQICTENNQVKLEPRVDMSSADAVEPMDTSGFVTDRSNPATVSCPPAGETFSGTITINNQSIIVTIENGLLTLAAPPEGYVRKEDDMVSLKEHLGMKDHEDIVLLNYDSGTKSIGKISTLSVSSYSQQEEMSESELALVDDCSLSALGSSLDTCPILKQGAGVLCAVKAADLVNPSHKATMTDRDNEDLQSVPLLRSKKDTVTSFACPEPGCSCTFDTRQKLKVHLLNHAEDPRPYQCTVEGCGWAFATSYKLKRHLQSHDKQRPHMCQFEGCGRCFTTVYNLKAHVKVHEQDNAFICEICSERFRSATRLTNHQRVHFEPQRPHKCEFPGNKDSCSLFSSNKLLLLDQS